MPLSARTPTSLSPGAWCSLRALNIQPRLLWVTLVYAAVLGCGKAPAALAPPPARSAAVSAPCERVAAAPSSAAPSSAAASSAAASPTALAAGILRFECERPDDAQRPRGFNGGGPDGSAWNWYGSDFTCAIAVRLDCDARVRFILRVGEHGRVELQTPKATGGSFTATLHVPSELWESELDKGDSPLETVPYSTVLFLARVDGFCLPTEDEPSGRVFVWTDSFVGAFSGGE